MDKLGKIIRVSSRLPISRLAEQLEMNTKEVWDKVFDWTDRFHFTIEGEEVVFTATGKEAFIAELEAEFQAWEKSTEKKEGKV